MLLSLSAHTLEAPDSPARSMFNSLPMRNPGNGLSPGIEASWRSFLRVSIFVNYVLLKSRQCLARVGWLRAIYRRVKGALRRPSQQE